MRRKRQDYYQQWSWYMRVIGAAEESGVIYHYSEASPTLNPLQRGFLHRDGFESAREVSKGFFHGKSFEA